MKEISMKHETIIKKAYRLLCAHGNDSTGEMDKFLDKIERMFPDLKKELKK